MSAGYASRLSEYPNKGKVGLPEVYDTRRSLSVKLKHLTEELRASTCKLIAYLSLSACGHTLLQLFFSSSILSRNFSDTVVLTGAGISTASGIPDFRGPNGIWTKEKEQKRPQKKKENVLRKRKRSSAGCEQPLGVEKEKPADNKQLFVRAQPSLTHRAITKLAMDGKLKYCVTQNVDGLHRRSGLSRDYHSTVHGCVFTEKCASCGCEYFRDNELDGLSFKPTGNRCNECGDEGLLHDILLDWEDPVLDLERVNAECAKADLILCLGTSLRIEPVGSLPLLAKKFVIVNLQVTPKDELASHVIRAKVDDVMESLMSNLGYENDWKDEPLPYIERKWKPDADQNKEWALLVDEYRQN
jgi:mono-ADP-ribosyltransferase sirtuin 6